MDNVTVKTNLTPIEIALSIDAEGRTTARKLYEFLELDKSNYSKWLKKNITENDFAEKDVDFYSYQSTSVGRGKFAEDYKLSAKFAKKLCMKAPGEKGELAREYFTLVEDKLKEIVNPMNWSIDDKIQLMAQGHFQVKKELTELKNDFYEFKDSLPLLGVDMQELTNIIHKVGVEALGGKSSYAYQDASLRSRVYRDIHTELRRQYNVTSYKAISRNKIEEAKSIVEKYELPIYLKDEVEMTNNQLRFEF